MIRLRLTRLLGDTFTNGGRLASIRVIAENTSTRQPQGVDREGTRLRTPTIRRSGVASAHCLQFPAGGVQRAAPATMKQFSPGNCSTRQCTPTGDWASSPSSPKGVIPNSLCANGNFKLPWMRRSSCADVPPAPKLVAAKVLFNNNTYTDGTVGDGTTDLGGPSPYEGFFVAVRNGGKLDLTMQNETLPLNDPTSATEPVLLHPDDGEREHL